MPLWLFLYKIINYKAFSLLAVLKYLLSQLNFIIVGKIYFDKRGSNKIRIRLLSTSMVNKSIGENY